MNIFGQSRVIKDSEFQYFFHIWTVTLPMFFSENSMCLKNRNPVINEIPAIVHFFLKFHHYVLKTRLQDMF